MGRQLPRPRRVSPPIYLVLAARSMLLGAQPRVVGIRRLSQSARLSAWSARRPALCLTNQVANRQQQPQLSVGYLMSPMRSVDRLGRRQQDKLHRKILRRHLASARSSLPRSFPDTKYLERAIFVTGDAQH